MALALTSAVGLSACGSTPKQAGPNYPELGQIVHAAMAAFRQASKYTVARTKGDTDSCTYTAKGMTKPGYKFDCTIWDKGGTSIATGVVVLQAGGNGKSGYDFSWSWTY